METGGTCLNENFLDVEKLNEFELNGVDYENGTNLDDTANGHSPLSKSNYVEGYQSQTNDNNNNSNNNNNNNNSGHYGSSQNKFNSFPRRQKKSKLKQAPKSASSLPHNGAKMDDLMNLSQDELSMNVKMAHFRAQEMDRLKHLIRNNYWPVKHPIRRYLWKCILQLNDQSRSNNSHTNKENSKLEPITNEVDYNKHLNQIFGKSREMDISFPEFVNMSTGAGPNPNKTHHFNFYFLNAKGKQAVKRVLCVYEYHYPHVTYNPGLVSITSLLLHYMQEHEVFSALCVLSSTKDHFIESKSSWDTTCSVFIKLLKNYCKSCHEIIARFAVDSFESIFEQWYWWIFDSLPFDFLVKIMDCYIFEGQKILYRVSLAIVQQFCRYLKMDNIQVNKDSIKNFCKVSLNLESIEKLMKTCFSIRNLKRSIIKDFHSKEENKRKHFGASHSPNQNKNEMALAPILNQNSPGRVFLSETSTGILSHADLCTIWNWIPQRLTVYTPQLLFTTQENGTSLNTLFNAMDHLEYSLIVIKTFQNEVFGAFCAGYWNDRKENLLYFGTGETFLFTIVPEKKVFKWVGTRNEKTAGNQEMFMRADGTKISIGGGGREGLSVFSNLIEGTTNRCDTFENDQLCSSSKFDIAILEVVGFAN